MKNLFFFFTVLTSLACSRSDIAEMPMNASAPAPTPQATVSVRSTAAPEKLDPKLQTELAKMAEVAKGRVGVGAVLLETGDTVYVDRKGQYPMQSVYKLPIAMAVLQMVDQGKVRIDQEVSITPNDFVRQGFHSPIRNANPQGIILPLGVILRFSIAESDGTASDVLLDLAGGPDAVMAYMKSIGIGDLIVADSEKSISKDWDTQYRNWSTPEASVQLLRALFERRAGLSEQMTDLLLITMTETETGGRRIKRGLPEGAVLAHKTGTGGTENGITGATNDIGIVTLPDGRHLLIAIYISDSSENGLVRQQLFGDIAKTVIAKWIPGSYPPDESNKANANRRGSNSNR